MSAAPIKLAERREAYQARAEQQQGENFSQIPHSFDQLVKEAATLAEIKVLWVIARQTYGYHKTTDRISFTRFEELTGLCCGSIKKGLEAGISRGVIIRSGSQNRGYSYSLNLPGTLQDRTPETNQECSTVQSASVLQDRTPVFYSVEAQNKTYKQNNLKKRNTEGGRDESPTQQPNSFRATVLPQSLINFIEDLTNYDLQEPANFNSNITTFGSLYKQYNLSQDEFIAVMYQTRAAMKATANIRNKGAWYTRKLTTTLQQIDKAQQDRSPADFDRNHAPATSPAQPAAERTTHHEQPAPAADQPQPARPATGDSGRTEPRPALPAYGGTTEAGRPGGTPPGGAARTMDVYPPRYDQGTDQSAPGGRDYKIDFSKYSAGGKYGYLARSGV